MRTRRFSAMTPLVTSLKVAALVSVLGAVVLAAEHHLEATPELTAARPTVAAPESQSHRGSEQPKGGYFPSRAPSGRVAEQPRTN